MHLIECNPFLKANLFSHNNLPLKVAPFELSPVIRYRSCKGTLPVPKGGHDAPSPCATELPHDGRRKFKQQLYLPATNLYPTEYFVVPEERATPAHISTNCWYAAGRYPRQGSNARPLFYFTPVRAASPDACGISTRYPWVPRSAMPQAFGPAPSARAIIIATHPHSFPYAFSHTKHDHSFAHITHATLRRRSTKPHAATAPHRSFPTKHHAQPHNLSSRTVSHLKEPSRE